MNFLKWSPFFLLTSICVYVCIYIIYCILQKYSEDANQKRIQKLKALRDRANSNDSVKSNEDNNEHQVFDQFTYRSNTTTNRKSTKLDATYITNVLLLLTIT